MVPGRRLLSLTFLSQQSFGYRPRAKRSRGNTRAGLVGYLFETVDNAIGNRGPTYVRANSAASSSVRTVTSRARRRDGLNTKSIMPRKLARHNRSSSGARRHLRTTPAMVAELPSAFGKWVILLTYWKPGRPRAPGCQTNDARNCEGLCSSRRESRSAGKGFATIKVAHYRRGGCV
jgi:hypothetical protein